jgi:hypothetical protein
VDLLARYLQAVKFWLPRRQKDDIVAELSENLRSEIEEREAERGRALTREELEAILTRWGHPMLVAQRYVPQDSLIGPVLMPAYKFALALAASIYLGPWLLTWIGFLLFDPARRTTDAVTDAIVAFWLMALHVLVAITAIFAAVERVQRKSRSLETWTAAKLTERQPARDPNEIPRSESIAALVVGPIMIWWWLSLLGTQVVYELDEAIRFTLRPISPMFYWPALVVLVAGVALASVNLFRPWWSRPRALARLAIDLLTLAIAVALFAAGPIVESVAAGMDADRAERLAVLVKWANLSWFITLAVIAVGSLLSGVQALRRVSGTNLPTTPPALRTAR